MDKIEINTTRNVHIAYELASLRDRVAAFALDRGVSVFSALVIGLLLTAISPAWISNTWLLTLFVLLFFVSYTFLFETLLNGQTPGKRFMNLRVVRMDGRELNTSSLFIRWAFRVVDIYLTGGALASLLIGSTDYRQRLGDQISHTAVIKHNSVSSFSLKDIVALKSGENHDSPYPELIHFSEAQMLALKELADRYRRMPNEQHAKLIADTAQAMSERLKVKPKGTDEQFLRELIREYVLLTR